LISTGRSDVFSDSIVRFETDSTFSIILFSGVPGIKSGVVINPAMADAATTTGEDRYTSPCPCFPGKLRFPVLMVTSPGPFCPTCPAAHPAQPAVDCFISLGVQCIIAESFGAIYERNAINAAFPIMDNAKISDLKLEDGDEIQVNLETGSIRNLSKNIALESAPFSEVQMEIYQNNGLF